MTDHDLENFERQLRRIKSAKPPEEFIACMLAVTPSHSSAGERARVRGTRVSAESATIEPSRNQPLTLTLSPSEGESESPQPSPPRASILDTLRMLPSALRWLIPATALALTAVVVWRGSLPSASRPTSPALNSQISAAVVPPVLTADDVKIDQQLVASFDAVARLPGGEPVRFRCESWMDQMVLSDKSHGVVVENRTPRFEVVAVGFETY